MDMTDANEICNPGFRLIIASMFLYIEYFKPFLVSFCNVLVRCLRSSYRF